MEKNNLYRKISEVMKDVAYLKKDDHIKFGSTNYKAISEEKVTQAVRASLIKHGLIILPVNQEHSKEGNLSTVNTTYKIVDIDTGIYEEIVSSGTGVDTQDKGVGKAMTYAYKYLLLRTFAIPTGEDPDKVSNEEIEDMELESLKKQYADLLTKNPHVFSKDDVSKFSYKQNWTADTFKKGINYLEKLKQERENILQHEADNQY